MALLEMMKKQGMETVKEIISAKDLQHAEYSDNMAECLNDIGKLINATKDGKAIQRDLIAMKEQILTLVTEREYNILISIPAPLHMTKLEEVKQDATQQTGIASLLSKYQKQDTKAPSKKQIETYVKLCKEKSVLPCNIALENSSTLSAKIEQLLAYFPVSAKQKRTIVNMCIRMNLEVPDLEKLTSGREGSASKLIGELMQMEKDFAETTPPTDGMIEWLYNYIGCPDIPFEFYNVTVKKDVDVQGMQNAWSWLSFEEFKAECKENLNKRTALELSEGYKQTYYVWKRGLASDKQKNRIKQLLQRLVNLYNSRTVETYTDITGSVAGEIKQGVLDTYNPADKYSIDDKFIDMITKQAASKYIKQLEFELKDASNRQVQFTDEGIGRHRLDEGRRDCNNCPRPDCDNCDNNDSVAEFMHLQNFIHKLCAIAGQNADDEQLVLSCLTMAEADADTVDYENSKKNIREFIDMVIELGENSNDQISIDLIYDLAQSSKSTIAKKMILGR